MHGAARVSFVGFSAGAPDRRRMLAWLVALLTMFAATSCAKDARPSVQIFAAASLRDACTDIAALWSDANPQVELVFNFAASNVLAQQIEASRAADLFLSADVEQMRRVRDAGALAREGPAVWLSNRLVVVAPASAEPFELSAAAELTHERFERLSIGHPQAVPAGRYAKAWLESEGVWGALEARVVPGVDVRAALAAVESGACELGIVYSTDAAISERVRVVFAVPLERGPRIEYAIATTVGPASPELAERVFAHFVSPAADAVFARRGFVVGRRE